MAVKRLHIGGAMRSGTTLLASLMGACFRFDYCPMGEVHLWVPAPPGRKRVCTKYPGDEIVARHVLKRDSDLWFIYMLRDPRDVVVSFHGMDRSAYFTNLRHWKESYAAAREMRTLPHFLEIRYEDLVTNPDTVQAQLQAKIPFLERTGAFSEWDGQGELGTQYTQAMRGGRKVDSSSIGAWRRHKGRLVAQMALHGDLSDILIELGYEPDKAWLAELEGVEPDTRPGKVADRISGGKAFRRKIRERLHAGVFMLRRATMER